MPLTKTLKLMTYAYTAFVAAQRVIRVVRLANQARIAFRKGAPLFRLAGRLVRSI